MKPNEDRVFLEPIPANEQTKGGIYIPGEAQKITIWKVLAIGDESGLCKECAAKRKQRLEVGMHVIINKDVGLEISLDDKPLVKIVRHGDIHGYE